MTELRHVYALTPTTGKCRCGKPRSHEIHVDPTNEEELLEATRAAVELSQPAKPDDEKRLQPVLEPGKVRCSHCGKVDAWGPAWSWYGRYEIHGEGYDAWEEAHPEWTACSDACREALEADVGRTA